MKQCEECKIVVEDPILYSFGDKCFRCGKDLIDK
jgi:hypothetical protein